MNMKQLLGVFTAFTAHLQAIFGGQAEVSGVCYVKRNETVNYDVVVWTLGFRLTVKVHSVSP